MTGQSSQTIRSIRRYQLSGMFMLVLLIGGFSGWSSFASIKGAIIAPGQIVVETQSKKIQHRDGGIVSEILVKEGDLVKAGAELLRIDSTELQSELSIVEAVLVESEAAQARLLALINGDTKLNFPAQLVEDASTPGTADVLMGQRKLFNAQLATAISRKEQLGHQIVQLKDEISGIQAQHKSISGQSKLIGKELKDVRKLQKKKLVRASRVLSLEREETRLAGEAGQLSAAVARAKGGIGETRLKILQVDEEGRREALTQLRETQTRIAQLKERKIAAEAKLKRAAMFAPRTGFVHQLNVHTVGGVIGAGETVMLIVPESDKLIIQVRLRPEDITQVHRDQEALVRLPAFDQRNTPQIIGKVIQVAPDLKQPEAPNPAYYEARVQLNEGEISKLGDIPLKPGMPVEVFVQTGSRTPINYLLKPLSDQMAHAFKER